MAKNKFMNTEININLKSRDELENMFVTSLNVIELQERQIENLKKGRFYARKFELRCYIIMSIICVFYFILGLEKGFSNYSSITDYLSVFISLAATFFCIIKLNKLFKRFFFNEDTIDYNQIKDDVILIRNVATEDLKFKMSEALENEDFVIAAHIRDELNKRV